MQINMVPATLGLFGLEEITQKPNCWKIRLYCYLMLYFSDVQAAIMLGMSYMYG